MFEKLVNIKLVNIKLVNIKLRNGIFPVAVASLNLCLKETGIDKKSLNYIYLYFPTDPYFP